MGAPGLGPVGLALTVPDSYLAEDSARAEPGQPARPIEAARALAGR